MSKTDIPLKDLPKELEGFRLAFISDTHAGGWNSRQFFNRAASLIKNSHVDLLLIGGDIVATERSGDWCSQLEALGNLSIPQGKYAVAGGHDHRFGFEVIKRDLASLGIRMLANEAVELKQNGSSLWLIGLDDNSEYPIRTNVVKALENLPANARTLVAVHSPDFIYLAKKLGFDLVLSGHTHGGQIRLPFIGSLAKVTELPRKYDHGLSEHGPCKLFVTRGLGSTIRMRLFCRPEISIITLTSAK